MDEQLIQRVARLEQQSLRWRWLAMASTLGMGLMVTWGGIAHGAPANLGVVNAREINLVDKAGQKVATLGFNAEERPGLFLLDANQSIRAGYGARGFAYFDAGGKVLASTAVSDSGSTVILDDAQGKPRLALEVTATGSSALKFFDGEGIPLYIVSPDAFDTGPASDSAQPPAD